jgi:lysyl-tRNA synthetase class 2
VVSGDPIGPTPEFDRLVSRFIAFARERDWRIVILGACEHCLDVYRRHGLHALYHGDEAVLEVASFSLDGRPIRKVRQSVHRLTAAGYTAQALHPRAIGPDLRVQLESIARTWRGSAPSRGFAMALDALFRLEDQDALFVIGRGPGGEPEGFLHFAVSQPGSALSLSSMPRLRTTPNGFNEWLVVEAVEWARAHGYARISLNFAPFAALLTPQAELSRGQRLERRALLALKGHFQLDNLLLFNRKFFPSWERRFVVYERRRDLPRVGIAALAAEAYLPFSGRDRHGS